MRIRRKIKRTTKQYIIVALICIVIMGSAAMVTSIITIGQIREEYEYMLNEAKQEMDDNKKTVYIALSDLRIGDVLTMDKVEQKTVYSGQPSESYITKDQLGKAAIIDIPKGTHIVKGMLARNLISTAWREIEYDVIHISPNIEANDYVDVRIVYPNGENYIVMSKKSLKGIQQGTPICYMWVDEEELLRMSAAIVDAAQYQGTRIFATKYIEPNIQDSSTTTYTPNISVLSLIEHDPNIVERCSQLLNKEVRKAMENRLAQSLGLDVSEISWELNDTEITYMPVMSPNQSNDNVGNMDIFQETDENTCKEACEDTCKEAREDICEDTCKEEENNINEDEYKSSIYFPELGNKGRTNESGYFATEG